MAAYRIQEFPKSRLATIDILEVGRRKHHIAGLIELDVTGIRERIRERNRSGGERISFTGWLISVIGVTVKAHEEACSFLKGRNRLMIFDDINVSVLVEKEIDGRKVPIPLVIEKAHEQSAESISTRIRMAREAELTEDDIVLQKKSQRMERLYFRLPGFLRRFVWKFLLRHPRMAFEKMGNVAFTSIGMMGRINGWFIPIAVHPLCFGIGSIIRQPGVVDGEIGVRDVLKMTILMDHDVIDGAQMARFISSLSENIESGMNLKLA